MLRNWENMSHSERMADYLNWHKRSTSQVANLATNVDASTKAGARDASIIMEGLAAHSSPDVFRETLKSTGMPVDSMSEDMFNRLYKGNRERGLSRHKKLRSQRAEELRSKRNLKSEGRIIPYDTEATGTGKIRGSDVAFDTEATGLGEVNKKAFTNRVGIFNIAFSRDGGEIISLYGESKIPFESGPVIKDIIAANEPGIKYARSKGISERDILKQFFAAIKEGDNLVGWNSISFDSPLMIRRLKDLNLEPEAAKAATLTHEDRMLKVKGFMDKIFSDYGDNTPWNFKSGVNPKGTSQEALAAGLGIDVKAAHVGGDDARVLNEIIKYSKDYKTFKKRFVPNLAKWAKFVDTQRKVEEPGARYTSYEEAFDPKNKKIARNQSAINNADLEGDIQYSKKTSELDEINWGTPDVKAVEGPVAQAAEEAAEEAVDDMSKLIADTVEKTDAPLKWLNEIATVKTAGILAGVTVGAMAVSNVKKYFEDKGDEVPEKLRIDARELGKPTYEIINDLKVAGTTERLNKEITAQYHTMKAGTIIGKQVEEEMSDLPNFVGAEVILEDRFLGVKGIADTVMHIEGEDRAIELKTIDDEDFDKLTGPKERHAMQANFYTHALRAKKGYVMYISREDPEKRVTFDVPYDPGSLIASVEKYRGAVYSAAQSGGYSTALEYFFGNKSGTRDQTNRSYLTGPGHRRTPNDPNNSYVGSRSISRNQ